jgi:hypothetical protein
MVAVIVLAGCAGGPSSKSGTPEPGFQLVGPDGPVKVLNGAAPVQTPIEVHWKEGPREDVTLSVTVTPAEQGVSAKVEPAVIERGEGKADVVIRCSDTARSGDYKLTVTGKTARAGTVTREILVQVPPIE